MKITRRELDRRRRAFVAELIAAGREQADAKRVALDMFAVYDLIEVDDLGREWVNVPDDDPDDPPARGPQ